MSQRGRRLLVVISVLAVWGLPQLVQAANYYVVTLSLDLGTFTIPSAEIFAEVRTSPENSQEVEGHVP